MGMLSAYIYGDRSLSTVLIWDLASATLVNKFTFNEDSIASSWNQESYRFHEIPLIWHKYTSHPSYYLETNPVN